MHIVTYDISNDNRRERVRKVLAAYATGGQRSVAECFLTAAELGALEAAIDALLDRETDRVMVIPLDGRAHVFTLGKAPQPVDPKFLYIGEGE